MREGGRKRAERHTHCAHHSLLRCVYARVRTRRDATVLLVTRARHTDAHRTGLRARKLHPAESDREKYKECERTETERATNDEMERKGRCDREQERKRETEERKRARYWQCSSALRKFSTATHSTTTPAPPHLILRPSLPPPSPFLLLLFPRPLAPNPSSIRARFCRVHRQINGVANTGRYICPRPHRPRSVQSTISPSPRLLPCSPASSTLLPLREPA